LTEQLEAVHFRFDEAAAMIVAPLLPDSASEPFDRTQRFIAGSRAGATLPSRICDGVLIFWPTRSKLAGGKE
jgi:hypothetical protein